MNPQIEVIGIDFIKAYLEDDLLVQFRIISGNTTEYAIRVSVEDPFFGSDFFIGPTVVRCREGINFWASFRIKDIMTDPILGFTGGFVLIFENADTGQQIYRRKFVNKAVMHGARAITSDSPYEQPRLYMIGDSHTWTTFGQYSEGIRKAGGHTLVRHVMYKVSSFTFWTGDFKGYLNMLPVEKQDSLLFSFGTYDLRKGCFNLAKKRGIPLNEIVYQTLFQKFYKLRYLKENYPDNHFIINSVVPPIRDSEFDDEHKKKYLANSGDEDRMDIYNTYLEFWQRQIKFLPNCSFLDWTDEYKDEDGFMKSDMLRPGDIHVGDFRPALKSLEEHLNKLKPFG